MLIVGRVSANVRDLLVYVTFNATAQWRIKLRQIANLQGIVNFRLPIADLRDAAMIATSSPAALGNRQLAIGNQFSNSLRYFSASIAATQPDPAAVTACL